MKDLYKHLGVSMNESADRIRSFLPFVKDEVIRGDCERVLLDPEARAVYDRNLNLLRKIADVRAELGIVGTSNWGPKMNSEMGGKIAGASAQPTAAKKGSDSGFGWSLLVALILAACLVGFLGHYFSEGSQFKRAEEADTVRAYKGYLGQNPDGHRADDAQKRIRQLELEAEWRAFDRRSKELGDTVNPASSTQQELFDLAAEIIEEMPESDTGREAAGFLVEARARFERQLANPEAAIHFYRLFEDKAAAELMMERLEAMVASTDRPEDLQAILSFFKDIDHLPGVSVVRIQPLRQRASDRLAERYRDFEFVRRVDTKEAYELYLKQMPSGSDAARARRRIVDLEVDEILKGDVGELPELQPLGNSNTLDLASVEISNDTSYSLTVRYSGRDSQKHVIAPKQKRTFQIRKGDYRVTATVDTGNVRPYAGNETINYDRYGVSFYIITTGF